MNFEEFKNLAVNTRCTRRFKSKIEIPINDLKELVDLARISSSAKNMQPLKYIIVNNHPYKDKVFKSISWASYLSNWSGPKEDERPSAYIIVVSDKNIDGFDMIDAGIAMQTIMLGASAKGYNGCILASIDKAEYAKLFNLGNNLLPLFAVALGKSSENIKLVNVQNNDINYYRDEDDTHCVPKRTLDKVLLGCF